MKQLVGALGAALALAWSAGAAAQTLNAEQAAGYCTAEGAFGERFGAESVNGRAQGRIMNSQRVTPAQAYPPFGELEVTFTHLSQRVHTINAVVRYPDERAALAAQEQLNAALSRRFAHSGESELGDGVAFTSVDPSQPGGYKAETVVLGPELQLICTDRALYQQTLNEVFGRAEIAQLPAPPQLVLPTTPPANVCETPSARAAFLAEFETHMNAIMNYGTDSARYLETLTRWKSQQMIQRGLWTEADSQAFALSMLQDPGFQRHFEATMGGLMAVLSGLQGAFDENRDERSRCTAGLTALSATLQMVRDGEAHWTYTAGLYDAEARRRGGTIE